MKLETTARILKSALLLAGRVTPSRSTIPVLGSVLFDGATVTGTDLDVEISVTMPARKAEGRACVPKATLLSIVKHLPPDADVTIEAGGEGATLRFAGGRYELPKIDPSDFPLLVPELQFTPAAADGERLKNAVVFVSPFSSTEETRYYLNGVCIDAEYAVATDGHRMGVHPLGFDGGVFEKAIIPNIAVSLISSLPAPRTIAIAQQKPAMDWICAGARVRSKLIDGTYPDWSRVVPTMSDNAIKVRLERSALLGSTRRVSSVPGVHGVRLAWDETRMAIASGSKYSEVKVREHIAMIGASAPGGVTFNAKYIRWLLSTIRSEAVDLWQQDPNGPTLWRGDADGGYAVLMPMRGDDAEIEMANGLLEELRQKEAA